MLLRIILRSNQPTYANTEVATPKNSSYFPAEQSELVPGMLLLLCDRFNWPRSVKLLLCDPRAPRSEYPSGS